MKKIIIILSILITFISFNLCDIYALENTVDKIDIHIQIDSKGHAHINEVWNIDVYEGTEIYKIMNHLNESDIIDYFVVDDHGYMYKTMEEWDIKRSFDYKSYKCGIIQDGDHYELCFGIADYGERKFTLNYTITNFVKQYKDYQGFESLIISDMTLPVKDLNIVIDSFQDFNDSNVNLYCFGFNGKMYFNNGDIYIQNNSPIELGQSVQMISQFNGDMYNDLYSSSSLLNNKIEDLKDKSDFTQDEYKVNDEYHSFVYKDDYTMIVFILGIVLLGVIGLLMLVFYTNYKAQLKEFSFNDQSQLDMNDIKTYKNTLNYDLFELYYLSTLCEIVDETNRHNLIAAMMLDWINKGLLSYKSCLNDDYEISFHNPSFENALEQDLYNYLKEASGSNQLLEKDEFDRWAQENYEKIDLWLDSVYSYIEDKYKNSGLMKTENIEGRWLFKKVNVSRDIYDVCIKDKIYHMLGLKQFLESQQYKHERHILTKLQWDYYMIYVYLFDLYDDINDELLDMQDHENYYIKVINKISKSAKK